MFTLASITSTTIIFNKIKENKSKEFCQTLLDKYYPTFNERNFKIPYFNQKDIYEKISFIQSHLNFSAEEKCMRATKDFPFVIKTPYNNQISPNYELTFFIQMMMTIYRVFFLIPVDMMLMNMIMFVILQFKTIVSDLVYIVHSKFF